MNNNKGVTLIALVFTIIIIMILASIAVFSGASIIRYTKFNKARAEIQVIQANVNEWYKEYCDAEGDEAKNRVLDNYGQYIDYFAEQNEEYLNTFSKAGVTKNLTDYRFFSGNYLKEKLGINASFDYLINIPERDTILFNGIIYNKNPYYTLKDFGLQNIQEASPDGIYFELEQGNNREIVIENLQIEYTKTIENTPREDNTDISKFYLYYRQSDKYNNIEDGWIEATKDVSKFIDESDGTKKTKFKFKVPKYDKYNVKIITTDKKYEHTETITIKARSGIKIGDYIRYTSPTPSVTFNEADTGYAGYATNSATLGRKTLFRVLDIDKFGNMTLIGAMTSSDPVIYFNGARGYNNVVYTLNEKCSDLYKDTSKGITARSIKVEDITDRFNQTGKDKITTNIDTQLASLTTGTYIENVDTTNRKVTYKTNTNYPDIFQYEAGGLIDNIPTTELIGQSESYAGYGGLTTLANKIPAPTNLTVPFTYYNINSASTDFLDTNNAETYQNMFFGADTLYWLASRCIYCDLSCSCFRVRCVQYSLINAYDMYVSYNTGGSTNGQVCPIVYLPSTVQVTVSKDNSTYHQTQPHVVQ